jgi:hypothetical protein
LVTKLDGRHKTDRISERGDLGYRASLRASQEAKGVGEFRAGSRAVP